MHSYTALVGIGAVGSKYSIDSMFELTVFVFARVFVGCSPKWRLVECRMSAEEAKEPLVARSRHLVELDV